MDADEAYDEDDDVAVYASAAASSDAAAGARYARDAAGAAIVIKDTGAGAARGKRIADLLWDDNDEGEEH